MEQRRLRLGDILDDYCPRERRVTNHAVVAMIEEDVKQTRCTTCDTEHAYKGARVPKRRKKETPAALYKEVLASMPEVDEASLPAAAALPAAVAAHPGGSGPTVAAHVDAIQPSAVEEPSLPPAPRPVAHLTQPVQPVSQAEGAAPGSDAEVADVPADAPVIEGPVHRALIRATLPRPEGQKDPRPVPDFTARHVPARGTGHGGFRGDRDRMRARGGASGAGNGNGNTYGHGNGNGNRAHGGPRFQGNRPSGQGRQAMGRPGGGGFRNGGGSGNGNGNGNGNKRGRGSRG
jgi:hypothetical protein